jgi:hypothetical protein
MWMNPLLKRSVFAAYTALSTLSKIIAFYLPEYTCCGFLITHEAMLDGMGLRRQRLADA